MKVKSNVKSGGPLIQHNQTLKGPRVRSGVKAGGIRWNHNQTVNR